MDRPEDVLMDRKILQWILNSTREGFILILVRWDGVVWRGLVWLGIGTGGELL
jgi:hypothetical protein